MSKVLPVILLSPAILYAFGCGGAANSTPNANKNSNANTAVNLAPSNVLPVPAATPSTTSTEPAVMPKGGTPTPGIPSPEEMKKLHKPGATPTPGIPSPSEIKRIYSNPPPNVNTPAANGRDVPMMKSNRPLGGKPKP